MPRALPGRRESCGNKIVSSNRFMYGEKKKKGNRGNRLLNPSTTPPRPRFRGGVWDGLRLYCAVPQHPSV